MDDDEFSNKFVLAIHEIPKSPNFNRFAVSFISRGHQFFTIKSFETKLLSMQAQEKFSYSAQPHAAPVKTRPKYRDEGEDANGGASQQNIMFDPRIARGNTYATKALTTSLKKDLENMTTKKTVRTGTRRNLGTRRSATPPPVDGRNHMTMQTEDFLEELTDRPIEQDAETQTQAFMDRPPSPLFVRAKIGYDVDTQIESGDLFDFDMEVEPILEVLVGKTLHVAMLEIMQEEELEAIRVQQEEYETIRNIELAEVQRLEAEIKRKAQEKERRIQQERKRLEERRKLEETIAARQFTNQFLGELHLSVFDMLEEQGHFYDPVQKEIEDVLMAQLTKGVVKGADCYEAASQVVAELLEAARLLAKKYEQESVQLREAWKEKKRLEEEAKRQKEEEERLAEEARRKAAEEAGDAPVDE